MAINQWANITLDPSAGSKSDRQDHRNSGSQGTSASGNLSVSWDSAKITSLTLWDSAVASARIIASSQLK